MRSASPKGKGDMRKSIIIALVALAVLHALAGTAAEGPMAEPEDFSVFAYAEVTVKSGTLNLRKSPSGKAPVLARIPRAEVVAVTSVEDPWCGVTYEGKNGYVMKEFLTFVEELPFSTLAEGDQGREVLELKKRLQELGYFRADGGQLSSEFNALTAERIKLFQLVNSLEATGVATAELQAFIHWGPAKKNGPVATPTVAAGTVPASDPESAASTASLPAISQTPGPTAEPTPEPSPTVTPVPTPGVLMLTLYLDKAVVAPGESVAATYRIFGAVPPLSFAWAWNLSSGGALLPELGTSGEDRQEAYSFTASAGDACSFTLTVTDGEGRSVTATRRVNIR